MNIRVLDNGLSGPRNNLLPRSTEFIRGDIRDNEAVSKALSGVDQVVHLAAFGSVVQSIQEPLENFEINARGTLNMLWGCVQNNVRKFVFASTGGALMGNSPPPVNEATVPAPISPYGASKLAGEGYCKAFSGSYGIESVILRFANVYGPHSAHKRGAVTNFTKCLLSDRPIVIYGDGNASRDFLFVEDLCEGIMLALEKSLPGGTVLHLAGGIETRILGLAKTMASVAGRPDHPILNEPVRKGEVERTFAEFDLAKQLIGFCPHTSLRAGLEQTWKWSLDNRNLLPA